MIIFLIHWIRRMTKDPAKPACGKARWGLLHYEHKKSLEFRDKITLTRKVQGFTRPPGMGRFPEQGKIFIRPQCEWGTFRRRISAIPGNNRAARTGLRR
jgi:hypothetical protein